MNTKKRTITISLVFAAIMLVSAYFGRGTDYVQIVLLLLIALWFILSDRLRKIAKR